MLFAVFRYRNAAPFDQDLALLRDGRMDPDFCWVHIMYLEETWQRVRSDRVDGYNYVVAVNSEFEVIREEHVG